MKRLKIIKIYAIFFLFLYFLVFTNLETIILYFTATLTFNIAVLTMVIIGTVIILSSAFQLVLLAGTFGTLAYKKNNLEFYLQGIEKIMPANIAHMFHNRAKKNLLMFTQEESRDVIDWLDEKFSNQKVYVNFFIGSVLMVGLFGTFAGLLKAIDEMGRIILSLSGDIDLAKVIGDFAGPLGGMAIGFSSSLFGVAAAIIMGILGYILSRNQESFIIGVEDWLKGRIIESGATRDTIEDPQAVQDGVMDMLASNMTTLNHELELMRKSHENLHKMVMDSMNHEQQVLKAMTAKFDTVNIGKFVHILANVETIMQSVDEKMGTMNLEMRDDKERLNRLFQEGVHAQLDAKQMAQSQANSVRQTELLEALVGLLQGANVRGAQPSSGQTPSPQAQQARPAQQQQRPKQSTVQPTHPAPKTPGQDPAVLEQDGFNKLFKKK
jgi:hypothetical protein